MRCHDRKRDHLDNEIGFCTPHDTSLNHAQSTKHRIAGRFLLEPVGSLPNSQ
jgi:hypothetical protein